MSIIREKGTPIPKNYEVGINNPFDSRLAVDSIDALNNPANWFALVEDDFGDTEVKFIGFKGMPVSEKSTGNLYVLRNYQIGTTIEDSTVEFDLIPTGSINPGDITLDGYATEKWVKEQGYVTASYLNGILTLSSEAGSIGTLPEDTTINELLDAKADNIPFTLSQAYITRPMGGYADMDNIAGKTVKEILTKLLGIVEKVTAPMITVGRGGESMTIKNSNNFPVTVQIVSNSWEGQVRQTGDMYENHRGSYNFEGSVFTLDANSSITKTNGWDSASGILEITSYSLSCYFEAYGIVSVTESKNKI